MSYTYEEVNHSAQFVRDRLKEMPKLGIILGTGLSTLTDHFEVSVSIPYEDIPHFPSSTAPGHRGELVAGRWEGVPVIAMAGRFHYYEGYSMKEVTFPVRVLAMLGIKRLLISNAAGGTNADYRAGDLVFIRDHINLHHDNPLRGPNDDRLGIRFPDMLHAYDRKLNAKALLVAKELGVRAHEGVYVGLPGPNLETPAEYQFINRIGGDVVGMSTVPEVIVARHMEVPLLVVSVVTNQCYPLEAISETTAEEVIAMAKATEPKLVNLLERMLADMY